MWAEEELEEYSLPWSVSVSGDSPRLSYSPLPRFGSEALPDGAGALVYTGGPTHVFDWHPSDASVFLTAAHPKTTPTHVFEKAYEGEGAIQLWKSEESGLPQCRGLISHDGHCVWELEWCPTSSEESSHRFIALLGNGDVVMYNINDLDWTSNSSEMDSVSFERFVLCSSENIEGLWSAVKWANDGEGLLVGSSRGMVALFDVNEGRGEPTLLWQAKHLKMAITSIEWVSQYQYVTAGNDKTSRVWDIREVGHFVYENFEYLSWGVVAAPLDEYRYALCTHEGEVRVVFPVSKNVKKPTSRNSKTRSILQVPGALNTIATRQISAEFDELEHVCYCGGSSGIVYRITIPESAHRAKRRRVTADEVARFEVDEDSSEGRTIRISLSIGFSSKRSRLDIATKPGGKIPAT